MKFLCFDITRTPLQKNLIKEGGGRSKVYRGRNYAILECFLMAGMLHIYISTSMLAMDERYIYWSAQPC